MAGLCRSEAGKFDSIKASGQKSAVACAATAHQDKEYEIILALTYNGTSIIAIRGKQA